MAWKRKTGVDTTTSLPTGLASWRKISSYIKQLIKASQFEYHESEAFEVKDVILKEPPSLRGAVIGTFLNNPNQEVFDGVVYPINPNITNIPLIGEQVAVIEYNGKHFYTNIINRKNSPNENAIPGASGGYRPNTKYGDTFQRNTKISRVNVNEGDIVYEGRFGNSIKLGSNPKNQAPNIRIRAGQDKQYDLINLPAKENINKDGSSIYLSTGERITIGGGKGGFSDKSVSGNSIVINSDKLFFNGRDGDVHIRASKDMILESSKGSIVLNAKSGQTIKMGDPRAPMIPTVNGQKLLELFTGLMKLLTAVPKLATPATMAQAGKDIAIELPKVTQQVVNKEFLNMQVMTADPAFKVPEPPKIPKLPDLKLKKLKLEQGIKLPKKLSVSDLTDKI